jgi:dihydrofolate reductase
MRRSTDVTEQTAAEATPAPRHGPGAAEEAARRPGPTGGRSVVVSTFVTLDGYMVGPDEDISWVSEGFDPEMQADIAEAMSRETDIFVFGRVTYEIFAAYWPRAVPYEAGDELRPSEGKEDPRIIRALNDSPKLVFSRTLGEPGWRNTRVVRGGPEDEIRRLRQEPGKAVSVQGSASIVQALARADLIDEYRLYVHPVLLGAGKPLFAPGPNRQDFDLVRVKPYANGVVAMSHRRKARVD